MYLWDSQIAANVYTNSTIVLSNITVSPDGNRLAGQTGSRIFVADRSAGTNWVIGESAPTTWLSHANLQFSADGQFLVYATTAALVPSDTNNTTDIYLYDFQAQTNLLISRSYAWDGAPNGASDSPAMSADGRFIAYRSAATDIVFGDTNGVPDVFLFDRQTRSTWLLSVSAFGNFAANNRSSSPVFSGDGQTIVFQSWASDLVAHARNPLMAVTARDKLSRGVYGQPDRLLLADPGWRGQHRWKPRLCYRPLTRKRSKVLPHCVLLN
jgi:Tol biopolymer transport system component